MISFRNTSSSFDMSNNDETFAHNDISKNHLNLKLFFVMILKFTNSLSMDCQKD